MTAAPLAHVVLGFDLDGSAGVDAPLDGNELRGELVVIGIDVDLAVLEQFPQCPVVLSSSIEESLLVDCRLTTIAFGRDQQRQQLVRDLGPIGRQTGPR